MSGVSCSICMEYYKIADEVCSTLCGHLYHKACIDEWQKRLATCPQCNSRSTQNHKVVLNIEDEHEENGNKLRQMKTQLDQSVHEKSDLDAQIQEMRATLDRLTIDKTELQSQLEVNLLSLHQYELDNGELQTKLHDIESTHEVLQIQLDETIAKNAALLSQAKANDDILLKLAQECSENDTNMNVVNQYVNSNAQRDEHIDGQRHREADERRRAIDLQLIEMASTERNSKADELMTAKVNFLEKKIDALTEHLETEITNSSKLSLENKKLQHLLKQKQSTQPPAPPKHNKSEAANQKQPQNANAANLTLENKKPEHLQTQMGHQKFQLPSGRTFAIPNAIAAQPMGPMHSIREPMYLPYHQRFPPPRQHIPFHPPNAVPTGPMGRGPVHSPRPMGPGPMHSPRPTGPGPMHSPLPMGPGPMHSQRPKGPEPMPSSRPQPLPPKKNNAIQPLPPKKNNAIQLLPNMSTVIIKGLPKEIADQPLEDVPIKLANKFDFKFTTNDIEYAHIFQGAKQDGKKWKRHQTDKVCLVVKFKNVNHANIFLSLRTMFSLLADTKHLVVEPFVAKGQQALFDYAKSLEYCGYHKVYIENGKIYVQKSAAENQSILISEKGDVDAIKKFQFLTKNH